MKTFYAESAIQVSLFCVLPKLCLPLKYVAQISKEILVFRSIIQHCYLPTILGVHSALQDPSPTLRSDACTCWPCGSSEKSHKLKLYRISYFLNTIIFFYANIKMKFEFFQNCLNCNQIYLRLYYNFIPMYIGIFFLTFFRRLHRLNL